MADKFQRSLKRFREHAEALEKSRHQVRRLNPGDKEVQIRGGKRLRIQTHARVVVEQMEVENLEDKSTRPICTYPKGPGAITLYGTDWERLAKGMYLNDQIINLVLRWSFNTTIAASNQDWVHLCDSHCYSEVVRGVNINDLEAGRATLMENIKRVSKWFNKNKGLTKNWVVLPICEASHWFLAVLGNEPDQITRILILDSLAVNTRNHVGEILGRLVDYVAPGRTYNTINVQVTQQSNTYDCGVHLLHNAGRLFKYMDTNARGELSDLEANLAQRTLTREELKALIIRIDHHPQQPKLAQQPQLAQQQPPLAQQQPQLPGKSQQKQQPPLTEHQPGRLLQPGERIVLRDGLEVENSTSSNWAIGNEVEAFLVETAEASRIDIHRSNQRRRIFLHKKDYGTYRFQIVRGTGGCKVRKVDV